MSDVYEIRDAGFVLLGWSRDKSTAFARAAEIETESDRETQVREVEYDAAAHGECEQIPATVSD